MNWKSSADEVKNNSAFIDAFLGLRKTEKE
jgi:hypothetical protein